MITIIPASLAHVGRIANRMRECDRQECAAFGHSPKQALRLGLKASVLAYTGMVDGSPHAMFGVSPVSVVEDFGRPWFLGSDETYRHGRDLIRLGPAYLDSFHNYFARLENHVSVENRKAIRLLARWGFDFYQGVETFGEVEFVTFWKDCRGV